MDCRVVLTLAVIGTASVQTTHPHGQYYYPWDDDRYPGTGTLLLGPSVVYYPIPWYCHLVLARACRATCGPFPLQTPLALTPRAAKIYPTVGQTLPRSLALPDSQAAELTAALAFLPDFCLTLVTPICLEFPLAESPYPLFPVGYYFCPTLPLL